MRELIPRTDEDDDVLPSHLRAQFELLQHLISKQNQENSETDDETIEYNGDETVIHMAVSTSMAAQREINGLLNGIAELENMLDEDSSASNSQDSNNGSDSFLVELDNKSSNKHDGVKNELDGKDKQKTPMGRKECLLPHDDER
mmetsp:Transcript_160/g.234  ORF Transcript_160/g.234 Transcript_160/m.234 type:complete len:144 (-) Transcript_160:31-462(-)